MQREFRFLGPALDGPATGGTLYNREICAGLRALNQPVRVLDRALALALVRVPLDSSPLWVDSLYLEHLPELRQHRRGGVPLGLLAHYLPTLVECGSGISANDLSSVESAALEAADCVLTTSGFMQGVLERCGVRDKPVFVVEPGAFASGLAPRAGAPRAAEGAPVRALLVANLVPGKGVQPFLTALAGALEPSDEFELVIVGSTDADARCATDCRLAVEQHAILSRRVRFTGALSPERVVLELKGADLLVSASRMETFGMVLHEARISGVPILAFDAGNVRQHVDAGSGGELVASDAALAHAFRRLCRDAGELERRRELARSHATEPRSWAKAAAEFRALMQGLRLQVPMGE